MTIFINTISGIVELDDSPFAATLRVYREDTGAFVEEVISDSEDGSYSFGIGATPLEDDLDFFVLCHYGEDVRPLAHGPLTPALTEVEQAAYDALVLSLDPLAYYRLGESEGVTAEDETGDYDGEYIGSPTLSADGLLDGDENTAVGFDGTARRVNLPAMGLAGSDITTVVLLYKCETKGGGIGCLIDFATQCGGRRIDLAYGASTVTMRAYNNGNIASHVLTVGETYHIVIKFEPLSEARIYIGGVSVDSGYMANTTAYGGQFAIASHTSNSYHAKGVLDEVAIFDKVLTQPEITSLSEAAGF
jgi:hypothetical protein